MNFRDILRRQNTRVEQRAQFSLSDPQLVEFLGIGQSTTAGVVVNESSSLGMTAVYRAVSIIAGTIASLPLKTYRRMPDDSRERIGSFLDDPGAAIGLTPFAWKELVMAHLLFHGNAYLLHIYNAAGGITALAPLHPTCVKVKRDTSVFGGFIYTVTGDDNVQRDYTQRDLTHIMGLSLDGVTGISPIRAARHAIGTGLAGDKAAARMFANGLLLGGIVTSDENLSEQDAETIKTSLKRKLGGADNAGDIAVVNASLKFNPWSMSADDAQFIESRAFQVEEIARLYGVPKVLLAQDGASTWGSGIAELIRGMQRFTFAPWTSRIEERLSALLARPRYVEFDYAGLLQPSPAESIDTMVKEIEAGLLTVDEARRLLNRPPLPTAEPNPPSPEDG